MRHHVQTLRACIRNIERNTLKDSYPNDTFNGYVSHERDIDLFSDWKNDTYLLLN